MKLHPREAIVRDARGEFLEFLLKWEGGKKLTPLEKAMMFQEEAQGQLKYALRWERHGDYNKEAGLDHRPVRKGRGD